MFSRKVHRFHLAVLLVLASTARAELPLDFDRDVRPILAEHCFRCHDDGSQKGGLRLDLKPNMLRGGDSGEPAVVPGSSLKSHLIQVVTSSDPDERMPPKGDPLPREQVAVLQRWIDSGAHWIEAQPSGETTTASAQPGMQVTDADRQFWSFRPPQKATLATDDEANLSRIDQLVRKRLAAVELTPNPEAPRNVLIRRLTYDLTGLPPTPQEVDAFVNDASPDAYARLVDRLLASPRFGERMASLWLPLARYAEDQAHLVGTDTSTSYPNAWKYRQWVIDAFNRDLPYDRFVTLQLAADKVPDADPADVPALGFLGLGPKLYGRGSVNVLADEWEDRVDTVTRTTLGLTVACARCHDHKFDPIPTTDYYALAGVFASTNMVNRTPSGEVVKGKINADKMPADVLHLVEDGEPQDLNLFIRGNPDTKGPVVPRRFLTVLSTGEPARFTEGSGRLQLAQAIVDPANPLTARVMVNRLWGMLFGNPLVATPSNFGRTGAAPSNPELLDDLAVRFMENGWSIKSVIREIATSATYRQSSAYDEAKATIDPANELLWRMNPRRLTVEQWRDTLLAVGDALRAGDGKSVELSEPENTCRTVYARISRLSLNAMLAQFDYPDPNIHAERRAVTNTPVQKLFVLNDPFILGAAKAFAARVTTESSAATDEQVRQAYRLLLSREPTGAELSLASAYLQRADAGSMSRWERYAQVLLASNEALYVD